MYKNFSQSHLGGRPKAGGFRGGGGGHGRGAGRGGRGGGARFGGAYIDKSKFINKPSATVAHSKPEHYTPENNFTDFAIDNRLKTNIASKNYFVPTPIQDKIIPHILLGKDVVGIANTGTGKTAAFLLPLIDKMLKAPNERVLIMVPTRELAQQIESELRDFANHLSMRSVCAVGGASIGMQIKALSGRPQFLIGTPGRLKDLSDRGRIRLKEYSTVVLDEADRMLDMGFINDVKMMLSQMPVSRHTLFFSATMSREIENLVRAFLKDPVVVSVKTGDTPDAIEQDIVEVPVGHNKFDVLVGLLSKPGFDKVLVFGKTKWGVQRLAEQLSGKGFKAESIHGNKSQPQRVRALSLFKQHHMNILCATDVAARGLDIAGVSHVINYDQPATYEDYVHRIGRTGRGGKKGQALTFI
ncbi:MAG: DEAD/DEAH box helicase [Patescibacteria group bacterium]|nr:DEAD/DEAH box helicase [Patescibacteria group bacterium]